MTRYYFSAALFLFAAAGFAQEAAQDSGSISGVLRDANDKAIPDNRVGASGPERTETTTDAQGAYTLKGLAAGRYRVSSYRPATSSRKYVTLAPGQQLEGVDLRFEPPGVIQGRVLDDNGEPMPGVRVYLIGTEYRYGQLRHTYRMLATTDDRGEYSLDRNVQAGVRYAVLAKTHTASLPAISDAPLRLEARRHAYRSTYYPGSPELAGAERLVLRGGETREGVDIRMTRTPSYCVSGVLASAGAPARLRFTFTELQPSSGTHAGGGMYARLSEGETGPDGKYRICDLSPGEYRLKARSPRNTSMTQLGVTDVVVIDRDVENLSARAPGLFELPGELVWAAEAPAEPSEREINIRVRPVFRSPYREEIHSTTASIPGKVVYPNLATDAYEVTVANLDDDWYVAGMEYGGRSILNDMLRMGGARPGAKLRISIARDGGRIEAAVTAEKDGDDDDIVTDAHVYVLPEAFVSEADLAAFMSRGQTDQRGRYVSGALRPGKYRVIATRAALGHAPEDIRKLWLARPKAVEVEVEPGETARVEIEVDLL